jgi:hypothetical protein
MITYIIIAVVIIGLLFLPIVRTILRWILFLPVALLIAFLYHYLDIPGLLLSWLLSEISPILGLISDVIDILLEFIFVTLVAKSICPSPPIGWLIAFIACLLLSFYNLITSHVYTLFPLNVCDSPIVWWHVVILVVISIAGAWEIKEAPIIDLS